MNPADSLFMPVVCLAGNLVLGVVFGIAALIDEPHRRKWRELASRIGLQSQTFFTTRLSGYSESHYVSIEGIFTPDPSNPADAEEGVHWTRIVMIITNPRQAAFIVGKSSVLNNVAGWFAKQFNNTTPLILGDDKSPQSFFVKESISGLVQSLVIRGSKVLPVLLATERTYSIQLDGPKLI